MIDRCPTCNREFEGFSEFPLANILSFKRIELPTAIGEITSRDNITDKIWKKRLLGKRTLVDNPEIPKDLLELLNKSDKNPVSYEGMVYRCAYDLFGDGRTRYNLSRDVTHIVNKAISTPEIESVLLNLENSVGREIRTSDIPKVKGLKVSADYGEFSICFVENIFIKCGDPREFEVQLRGIGSTYVDIPEVIQEIARVEYEGRIKPSIIREPAHSAL